MAQLALALPGVVVAEQEIVLDRDRKTRFSNKLFDNHNSRLAMRGSTSRTRVCNACTSSERSQHHVLGHTFASKIFLNGDGTGEIDMHCAVTFIHLLGLRTSGTA